MGEVVARKKRNRSAKADTPRKSARLSGQSSANPAAAEEDVPSGNESDSHSESELGPELDKDDDQATDRADVIDANHPDVIAGRVPAWSRPLKPWKFAPAITKTRFSKKEKEELNKHNMDADAWFFGLPPSQKLYCKDFVARGKFKFRTYPPSGALEKARPGLMAEFRDAGRDVNKRPYKTGLIGAQALFAANSYNSSRGCFVLPYLGLTQMYELNEFLDLHVLQHFLKPYLETYSAQAGIDEPAQPDGDGKKAKRPTPTVPNKNRVLDYVRELVHHPRLKLKTQYKEKYPSLLVTKNPEFNILPMDEYENAERLPKDPKHFIWGHSHEDWMRAYFTFMLFLYRRRSADPVTWTRKAAQTATVAWAGFYDAKEAAEGGNQELTGAQIASEASIEMEQVLAATEDDDDDGSESETEDDKHRHFKENLERMGMQEQLEQYEATYSSDLREYQKNTLRQAIAADQQYKVFSLFQPSRKIKCAIEEAGTKPAVAKLSKAQIDYLIGAANTFANVQKHERVGNDLPTMGGGDTRLLAVSAGEGEEAVRHQLAKDRNELREEAPDMYNASALEGDEDMARLRESRRLMGGNIPEPKDLASIVAGFQIAPEGATWDKCPINKDLPDFVLKPHQIRDIDWLLEQLKHPIRGAILANECGIGKTMTALYALAEAIRRHVIEHEGDPEWRYYPSAIVMPASVLDQTFKVIKENFYHLFKVHVFYQTPKTAPKHRVKETLDKTKGLVKLFDRLKAERNKPETASNIILMSYTTNNRRLLENDRREHVEAETDARSTEGAADPEDSEEEEDIPGEDDAQNPEVDNDGDIEMEGTTRPKGSVATRKTNFDLPCKIRLFGLIEDEGHALKDPGSLAYIMCEKFTKHFTWIDSAFGYQAAGAIEHDHLEVIYSDEYVDAFKRRDTQAMIELGVPISSLLGMTEGAEAQEEASGAQPKPPTQQQIARREGFRAAMEGGLPVYLLNPHNFMEYGKMLSFNVEFTSTAVKHALAQCQIRRGMLTPMVLPDGRTTCPGEDMPACDVETVEVAPLRKEDVKRLDRLISTYNNDLISPPPSDILPTIGGGGTVKRHDKPRINLAAMRNASLVSTDLRFATLTDPSRRMARATMDAAGARKLQSLGGASLSTHAKHQKAVDDARERSQRREEDDDGIVEGASNDGPKPEAEAARLQRAKAKRRPAPTAGVKEVNNVISKDVTHGLQYYYFATRTDPDMGCPVDAVLLARWVIAKSPKAAWCLSYALKLSEEGKRCLFYTVNPLTSMMLAALFRICGLETLAIRSSNNQSERDRMIADFNDPNTKVDVMVTSSLLAAFGVNYHNACHHGVIMENCPNFGLQCQVIGRLWRLGQKEKVSWKILQTQSTFDPWLETKNMRAYVSTVEAEAAIDARITGSLRTVCAFEVLRIYVGAPFNYYPRTYRPWKHLNKPEVCQEGYLFSAVAQWLIAHPEDFEDVDTMSSIAKRWNPTMKMTRDILVGRAPELDPEDATKFDYFTAIDPRLINNEERAELLKTLGIDETTTPVKGKKGKGKDAFNPFESTTMSARKGRNELQLRDRTW
ncbi:uncharacterized protein CCOS01_17083 [Colletotrichum costaricense]|uniref:Helicase C-terminal domain-containing protein n=1 Tax=Colletotrichum costaricense TaxID=1209916 RepID=A0AAI9YEI7_9PEZI|nr:uncharacterized protein CCOS01_17083 [Colletotrichum costaricense]KAK1503144.1 hypothetical protein CCOS01_17083 [Colletotrichum costaricense]